MPRGNLDWPARLERTDESFRSHPSPRPSPRWYVFSGRRSSPHGVPALAGRATEVLGYWAWPETQPAKAGTPCNERRGHAEHITSLRERETPGTRDRLLRQRRAERRLSAPAEAAPPFSLSQ